LLILATPIFKRAEGYYSANVLFFQSIKDKLLNSLQARIQNGKLRSGAVTLQFVSKASEVPKDLGSDRVAVMTSPDVKDHHFTFAQYTDNLKTKTLGKVVMYADVVSSTMDMFDG